MLGPATHRVVIRGAYHVRGMTSFTCPTLTVKAIDNIFTIKPWLNPSVHRVAMACLHLTELVYDFLNGVFDRRVDQSNR